ncbi:MAG: glycerol-3-phosphate acyltransferase [Ignavibacteriales bacterium]|nr:glycerol-3-phosphate acyltransferase [Ignavibacteriales bacterium]
MEYLLSIAAGFLLGSFPTAFVLLKKIKGIDITQNGSANVGAFNSYVVTKSKMIGLAVLIIDALKGLVTVLVIRNLIGTEFIFEMLGLIAAVLSHCFSFWIGFKGGRGLAVAAGGALILSIPVLSIWLILWLVAYVFRKNIHFANFAATLLTVGLSFSNASIMNKYTTPPAASNMEFSITVSMMLTIILIKHFKPIKEYFTTQNKKN